MVPFSCVVTPTSIVFASSTGKMINISQAHINFDRIKETIKELQVALKNEDVQLADELHIKASALANPAKTINRQGKGRVTVEDGIVKFDGEPIRSVIAERILQSLREGFSVESYIKFIENLMNNPSKRAVDELYGFIEKSTMGITDDGYIIAYKRVRNDYTDCHSGKFDNSVGAVLEMARNAVDDNKDRTCSYGFHFCSFSYLGHFGSAARGDRIVIVKVNPADVVSIPADYNDAKARCCKYTVIGEYEGDDKEDILATRSVWNGDDWREDVPTEDDGDYDSDWEASDYDEWYYSSDSGEDDDLDDLDDLDDDDDDDFDSIVETITADRDAGPTKVVPAAFVTPEIKSAEPNRYYSWEDKAYIYEYHLPPRGESGLIWVNTGDNGARYTYNWGTGRWDAIAASKKDASVEKLPTIDRDGLKLYYSDKAPASNNGDPKFRWVDTVNNKVKVYDTWARLWVPTTVKINSVEDASYRLTNGRYITDVTYAYKADGAFVSAKLRFSDGANLTFDRQADLPDVDKLIARSTSAPRIRCEIV